MECLFPTGHRPTASASPTLEASTPWAHHLQPSADDQVGEDAVHALDEAQGDSVVYPACLGTNMRRGGSTVGQMGLCWDWIPVGLVGRWASLGHAYLVFQGGGGVGLVGRKSKAPAGRRQTSKNGYRWYRWLDLTRKPARPLRSDGYVGLVRAVSSVEQELKCLLVQNEPS